MLLDAPGRPAAQEGADPRQKLGEGERLDQVVVGPDFEPFDPIVYRIPGTEDENGRRPALPPEFVDDAQAVTSRQHQIHNRHIRLACEGRLESFFPIGRHIDRKAGLPQAAANELGDSLVVLDDERVHSSGVVAGHVHRASECGGAARRY